MNYSEKLKDPRWQKKRLEIFQRDEFQCQICFEETKTLHVHHRIYLPKAQPWEYDDHLLVTLCADCHEQETALKQEATTTLYNAVAGRGFYNDDIICLAEFITLLPFVKFPPFEHEFLKFVAIDKAAHKMLVDMFKEWQKQTTINNDDLLF